MTTGSPVDNTSPFASWKIDHAGVRVGEIEAAVAWYVETLDCRVVRRCSVGSKQFRWLFRPRAAGIIVELLANSVPDTKPLNDDFQLLSRPHLGFVDGSVDEAIAVIEPIAD